MTPYSQTAADVPVVQLADAVEFLDHMRRPVTEEERTPGPYPYFGANGQQGWIDRYLFDEPLVLLAEDGGHFENPERGIAYRISGKTWVNNHAHVLRPRDGVDLSYLYRALENADVRKHVTGTTRAKLTKAGASKIPIPLPSPQDQRRIAEVLDRADRLRAKRRAALALLDTLTQSIFLEMFGNPVSNPKGWVVATLGDVATFVGGGTPSRAIPEYFSGALCWATSKDMKGCFLDDTEEHVTELAVQKSATKLVSPGTILVVVKSKVLMHRLPVAVARVQTCFGQDLKGITLDDRCTVSYVATALRTCQGWLLDRARGINTEGLSLDHLRRFPLLLPPLSLQKDFERRAEQVEVLRQSLGHSLSQLETLFASLQHRAFRGEL